MKKIILVILSVCFVYVVQAQITPDSSKALVACKQLQEKMRKCTSTQEYYYSEITERVTRLYRNYYMAITKADDERLANHLLKVYQTKKKKDLSSLNDEVRDFSGYIMDKRIEQIIETIKKLEDEIQKVHKE